jgi:hypothetical protein
MTVGLDLLNIESQAYRITYRLMPLSSPLHTEKSNRSVHAFVWFGTHEYRVSLPTMGESKDDLWLWWRDPKIFYPDSPDKPYADAFIRILELHVFS